ncbi:MAG TPA: 6-phosphogluconolactonase [bacterium]|nr:6-phosphogluconolactonase [bacterium]
MTPDVRVFPELDALSRAVAETFVSEALQAIRTSGRCTVALAGGSTPRRLYRFLAFGYAERLPWPAVQLFMGDERYVPPGDTLSNFRMVQETLIDHLPVPPVNVHPTDTSYADPALAAEAYEQVLRGYFSGDWPRFDVVFLGMGTDGHTASLFPGTPALLETTRWVVATTSPRQPPDRLTLTLPVFNHAQHVHFLVAGPAKADALRQVLMTPETTRCTAARVKPIDGHVTWWADEAAAAGVEELVQERGAQAT